MADAKLIHHLRNYASAGVLSALLGLISFPLLTRNLSVADYGLVGLIASSATFFIAIGKLGMQHAVIRYFAQVKNGNSVFTLVQMNSTVVAVFSLLAGMATLLWLLSGFYLLPGFLQSENIPSLFLLGSGIVFVRIIGSGVMNFLRAQQRSGHVAIAQSTVRFLNLTLLLVVLVSTGLNPWLVIACLFLAESAGMGYAAWQYRHDFLFELKEVSGKLAKVMLFYGLPLMILESLSLVLRLSDRYLIESMLGVGSLGQYSASYNLCSYLEIIVIAAILQAVRPAYLQLWETEGKQKTAMFLSDAFHLYMVVGIAFIAMFAVTSPYLLSLLAGPKYQPGTVIIPYVALSFWMDGAMLFLAAGLYIFKNTKVLMLCGLAATIVNVVLNVLLIPRYGITGAAVVTVFSYALFMFAVTVLAFRRVSFAIQLSRPMLMAAMSGVVYASLTSFDMGSDMANLVVKGGLGTLVLILTLWVLVPEFRVWARIRTEHILRRRSA